MNGTSEDLNVKVDEVKDEASAIFELVGLKELAEFEPSTYYERIQTFLDQAQSATVKVSRLSGEASAGALIIKSALDKLFVSAPSRRLIFGFACRLRRGLIFETKQLFLRGVIGRGDCFSPSGKGMRREASAGNGLRFEIVDLRISSVGVGLHGELEKLKGVGFKCREDLGSFAEINNILGDLGRASEIPGGTAERGSEVSGLRVFTNFMVSNLQPQRFSPFHDIALGSQVTDVPEYLRQAIAALREGRLRGNKVARLYVPFLLNWARTMDLSVEAPKRRSPKKFAPLDILIMDTVFSDLMRDVPGLQLVPLVFLDRVFKSTEHIADGRRETLKSFFLDSRRKWLQRLVRLDTEPSVPSNILSDASRRKFSEELAKKS